VLWLLFSLFPLSDVVVVVVVVVLPPPSHYHADGRWDSQAHYEPHHRNGLVVERMMDYVQVHNRKKDMLLSHPYYSLKIERVSKTAAHIPHEVQVGLRVSPWHILRLSPCLSLSNLSEFM